MKNGPQHAVGEAVVIFLNVGLRQIDQDVGHLVDVHGPRFAGLLVGDLAAPAKPQAISIFERSHRHSAGEWGAAGSGTATPVRDYDQAAPIWRSPSEWVDGWRGLRHSGPGRKARRNPLRRGPERQWDQRVSAARRPIMGLSFSSAHRRLQAASRTRRACFPHI